MKLSSTLTLTLLSTLASASPLLSARAALENFYLVTTTQRASTTNSSLLAGVSATALFDPYHQTNFLLRQIAPGYGSLPTFNISSGTLHSIAGGPFPNEGPYEYNSTEVQSGSELQFLPALQGAKGDLSLKKGYLLAVNGTAVGWTVCSPSDALGQQVIEYKGTDASCTDVFIHAVTQPPY